VERSFFLAILCGFLSGRTLSQQSPAITGISHVTFYADDIAKSRQFYVETLGWHPEPATGTQAGLRFYANHAQYVELQPPPVSGQEHRLALVGFATADADRLLQFLDGKGIAVPASVTVESDGSRSFLVHDSEGNPVEFTQQGRRLTSPSPAALKLPLSTHIMHAGYEVHNRALLDHFYKDLLGFHLYWQGDVDWVMMQVPNGTDWIEYMLYLPAKPTRAQLGSADHIAPGVVSVADLQRRLEQPGWTPPECKNPQVLGVDGKLQLDLIHPDGTRIEFVYGVQAGQACVLLALYGHAAGSIGCMVSEAQFGGKMKRHIFALVLAALISPTLSVAQPDRSGPKSATASDEFGVTVDAALVAMRARAHELGVTGVAVVAYFEDETIQTWSSKMIVVGNYRLIQRRATKAQTYSPSPTLRPPRWPICTRIAGVGSGRP
jgi:catechol 2,3-dioxygenase-like lactoylglutathione lyase family enzyme